jgi:putative ABC transport system ATP-binding protein
MAADRIRAVRFDRVLPRHFVPSEGSAIWRREFHLDLACDGDGPSGVAVHQVYSPSGTGKTSLAAFLSGLRFDYTGSIHYEGLDAHPFGSRPLSGWAAEAWAWARRQHISMVYQDFRLIPWLSPRDNLKLRPTSLHEAHASAAETADWAARLELDIARSKPASTLSRGEQQRLAIIRALVQPFDLLILDEAFSHLDLRLHRLAAELILERARKLEAGIISLDLEFSEILPARSRLLLHGSHP